MKTNALSLRIQDDLNATGLLTVEGLEPTAQSFTSGSEVNQVTFKMVLEPIKMLLEKFRSNNRIVNEQSCVKLFKTLLLIVKSYRLSISSARELLFLNKFVQKDDNRFVSCSDEVIVLYLKIMSQLFKKYDLLCHVSCFTFILTLNTLFKTKSMEILRYSLKLLHVLFGKHHRPISFESFINYKEILDRIFPGIATSLFQKLCLEEKRSLIRIKILEVLADLIVYFIGDHLPDKYSKDSVVDISSPYTNSNRVSFIIKTIINECSLSGSQDIKTTCSVFTSRIMIELLRITEKSRA
ncbi:hypothetical protein RF11_08408 [Thelohanellus kitauei]|uniref:Uncharacterized protein n=1 Tax=Thelohanellus kitauei TaxID=669202 RepID=A0A0C2M0D2_THEKT|nr:hypothetical protein RF11_08408 [Thelohanellus kitauei]